jgi:hypothetical protein
MEEQMLQITSSPNPVETSLNPTLFEISQLASLVSHIIKVTSDVLQTRSSYEVIDRITITRGYAELSLIHPHVTEYRHRTSTSLLKLSETVGSVGNLTLAAQLRSLADRCQKLAACTYANDPWLARDPY